MLAHGEPSNSAIHSMCTGFDNGCVRLKPPSQHLTLLELHHPAHAIRLDRILRSELAFQYQLSQRIFQLCLDGAFQRPCAVYRVEAGVGDLGQCAVGDLQFHFYRSQAFFQIAQLDARDGLDVFFVQRVEHYHLVHAINELGAEMHFHFGHYRQLDHLVIVAGHLLVHLRTEIRGHDDYHIFKIYGAPLTIGHADEGLPQHLLHNLRKQCFAYVHVSPQVL